MIFTEPNINRIFHLGVVRNFQFHIASSTAACELDGPTSVPNNALPVPAAIPRSNRAGFVGCIRSGNPFAGSKIQSTVPA
jgi:hypothetical protein